MAEFKQLASACDVLLPPNGQSKSGDAPLSGGINLALREESRERRLAEKLTQEKLAFQAGISRNYVSLIELNQKSPTVDVFMRVCEAIGVSAATVIASVERKKER